MGQISDGSSNTHLFGEKYTNPDHYLDGIMHENCTSLYDGWSPNSVRYANDGSGGGPANRLYGTPSRDTPDFTIYDTFGSPHVSGCNFVFCDGSVHTISFGIDARTHNNLSARCDGRSIDMGALTNN